MPHLEPWYCTKLNNLLHKREGTRNDGLARDHRGRCGQPHQWDQQPSREQQEERVGGCVGIGKHQGALAEIVQHQCRHHQGEPVDADRAAAKMPHIGVQRFAAGQSQKHRAEHGEGDPAVGVPEIGERVARIERNQYSGPSEDMRDPGEPEYHEPRRHHRSEKSADAAAAPALDHKKCDQHHSRHRHDIRPKYRGCDLQPLDRAQDRNCRSDHGIAKKQRGATEPDCQ